MLKLIDITKTYGNKNIQPVHALKGISLTFRKNEFVAVLGPSGCGKTTLLNIVGGLDHYTTGDLVISGKSTKEYKDHDWDAYRNNSVGFVFQNYNLIQHQSVLSNVELALTLSGISKKERRQRATNALTRVGLADQLRKRPNQLSGGQMQRVAIARAIVNDPEIVLADEPTGALDSEISVQIMEILKEISNERLVIMVTHNSELANKYSNRIIKLLDGLVVSDSKPLKEKETNSEQETKEPEVSPENLSRKEAMQIKKELKKNRAKTSMNFFSALRLSFNNLVTKKTRTLLVSFAGSIGIIGIALVLALSNGFNGYISNLQKGTLAGFPVTVSQVSLDIAAMMGNMNSMSQLDSTGAFPDIDNIIIEKPETFRSYQYNEITQDYLDYIAQMPSGISRDAMLEYSVAPAFVTKVKESDTDLVNVTIGGSATMLSDSSFQPIPRFMLQSDTYTLLAGDYPASRNELVVVVDKYNKIPSNVMQLLGMMNGSTILTEDTPVSFSTILNKKYVRVTQNDRYRFDDVVASTTYGRWVNSAIPLNAYENPDPDEVFTIVGIIRAVADAPIDLLTPGLGYLPDEFYTDEFFEECSNSDIAAWTMNQFMIQLNPLHPNYDPAYKPLNPFTGAEYLALNNETIANAVNLSSLLMNTPLGALGYIGISLFPGQKVMPNKISFFPISFETKKDLLTYLTAYNVRFDEEIAQLSPNLTANERKEEIARIEGQKILFTDAAAILSDTMGQMVDIISYVLIAFSAISLFVSSIMIGVITYISVLERTKEIGILRSIGARKKDIKRVFWAESIIVGFCAGMLGVILAYLLTIPIGLIITHFAGISGLVSLSPLAALALVGVSTALTFIAGSIPSRMATKKDPVVALRE